jgi:cell division protein FtsI/penicillin-binding protein 2
MEAQTGKVLTIVNQDWAIRSGIKPCSTIKLVTGVAGLNEGIINKEDGSVRNTRTRRDLDDAIAFSDNGYFQRVGSNLGSPKMIEYAKDLGLGQPTGLNAPGEYAGKLPYGNNNVRIYSHGDDFEVTPLQLAVLVSEISNGGKKLIPRIPAQQH